MPLTDDQVAKLRAIAAEGTADVALTVPAEYVEDFRAAMLEEIATDTRWVKSQWKALAAATERGAATDAVRADLSGSKRHLAQDVELLAQAGLDGDGAIEISDSCDTSTIAHVCETMARDIVGAQLHDALACSPIAVEEAPGLRRLVEELGWAIARAEEFGELDDDEA